MRGTSLKGSHRGPTGLKAGLPPRDGRKPSLGWLARREPNRVLHRVINGFPGQAMLALRFMEDEAVRDLIAYMRTLDPDTP